MEAQHAVNALCVHLLGEDWHIVDPVRNEQANDIIVDTIMENYPPKSMTRVDKWRKRHKQCRWCTHCYENLDYDNKNYTIGVVYGCKAKGLEFVNPYRSRPFCTLFNLKKEKQNEHQD